MNILPLSLTGIQYEFGLWGCGMRKYLALVLVLMCKQVMADPYLYCDSAKAYFPYVSTCPEQWRKVSTLPPDMQQVHTAPVTESAWVPVSEVSKTKTIEENNAYPEGLQQTIRSAQQGDAAAQNSLGLIYREGKEIPNNDTEAFDWFSKSANQGNVEAQFNLGAAYYFGQGVSQDYKKASEWLRIAANNKNSDAQYLLGKMYANGEGVQQNLSEAAEWLNMASLHGNLEAKQSLLLVESALEKESSEKTKECTSHCGQSVSQDTAQFVAPPVAKPVKEENGSMGGLLILALFIGLPIWFFRSLKTFGSAKQKTQDIPKINITVTSRKVSNTGSTSTPHANRLQESSPSEFRIPSAPAGYGAAKWIPHGQSVTIAGITIPDGMIYVGTNSKSGYGSDPCQIDPSKSVASSGEFTERQFGYWPSYSDISATARRAYLNWLAGGRGHPDADVGYVFLFFYGLERRVIIDAEQADYPVIAQEIRRLLSIYGNKSGSFKSYASGLLDWISITQQQKNKLYLEPVPELSKSYELPLYIRLALGMAAVDGAPIPKRLACAWAKLEPNIVTRTPGRRCPEYFDKLFEIKYTETFDSGMIVRPNKTKLKAVYRPASAGFRSCNQSLLTKTFGDLPDVSILTEPLKKLQQLIYAVNDDLSPYSRAIAKNTDDKNTLDSLIYLPLAIWPDDVQKALNDIKLMLEQGATTLLFSELLSRLNGGNIFFKEKVTVLARTLESAGIGMEPDVLGGAKPPKADGKVVLFAEPDKELSRTTGAYKAALLTLQLSSSVAMADGDFSASELAYLQNQIKLWTHLSINHQRRLHAHLILLKAVPPLSLTGIKKRFEHLSQPEIESIAAFLATVAQADGVVSPSEVDVLKKIYKTLGVDPKKVFTDLHVAASGAEPAPATSASEATGFTLNADRIAHLQRESAKVSTLLAGIFKEDEPIIINTPPQEIEIEKVEDVDNSQRLLGLDESHGALARMLLSRPQWSREDLLDVAADLNLMLDGALEHINEASFELFDIAFTEGENPITINPEIFEKI